MSTIQVDGLTIRLQSDVYNNFNPSYAFAGCCFGGVVGLREVKTGHILLPKDVDGNITVSPGTHYSIVVVGVQPPLQLQHSAASVKVNDVCDSFGTATHKDKRRGVERGHSKPGKQAAHSTSSASISERALPHSGISGVAQHINVGGQTDRSPQQRKRPHGSVGPSKDGGDKTTLAKHQKMERQPSHIMPPISPSKSNRDMSEEDQPISSVFTSFVPTDMGSADAPRARDPKHASDTHRRRQLASDSSTVKRLPRSDGGSSTLPPNVNATKKSPKGQPTELALNDTRAAENTPLVSVFASMKPNESVHPLPALQPGVRSTSPPDSLATHTNPAAPLPTKRKPRPPIDTSSDSD